MDDKAPNAQVAAFIGGEGDQWLIRNKANLLAPLQPWESTLFEVVSQSTTPESRTFLEVGSSSGNRLIRINSVLKMNAVGIDPSSQAIKEGIEAHGDLAHFQIGTATSIPIGDREVAVLLFGFCLYLVPESIFPEVIEEVERVLKPSGFVAILDFDFEERVSVPYKHKQGLESYRRPYAEVFGAAGYSLIAKLPIQKQGPVQERIALAENPMDRISAWIFKAPSQEPVADIG